MRKIFFLCLSLSLTASGYAQRNHLGEVNSFSVYCFLLEDCPVTQAYTDKLNALYQEFACDSIAFLGAFPNPVSGDSTISAFVNRYAIPFTCMHEGAYALAKRYGIAVTPEIVVVNETRGVVLYQGRIDNRFERVGKRRQVVTTNELEDALHCIRASWPILTPRTQAVGCILN